MEQLGLSYVAAACRQQGFSARIIDGCLQAEDYDREIARLANGDYSVIGYPLYSENLNRVTRDVLQLRERGITTHVTVGNHLPTLCATDLLKAHPHFDSAVRGEGEATFVDLVRAVGAGCSLGGIKGITYRDESGIEANASRPNVSDLDSLPFPARDTLKLVLAAGNVPLIYTSRGCNARCDFCSVHKFFNASPDGAWRGRSPRNVVDEMETLLNDFGVREFAFADEQFMGHGPSGRDRALGIAAEIRRRRLDVNWYIETRASSVSRDVFSVLRDAGLRVVFMGLESGYDPTLKRFRKGLSVSTSLQAVNILRELEIIPSGGFIMFHPNTSLGELRANVEFLEQAGCVEVTALTTELRLYPGTNLTEELRRADAVDDEAWRMPSWNCSDQRVEFCRRTLFKASRLVSAAFNEFAAFRRRGILTFEETTELQRAMNVGPLRVMRELLSRLERGSLPDQDLEAWAIGAFEDAVASFFYTLRFVSVLAERPRELQGVRLLSPMYLC
jgi:anaerobic magnesium-protoporphyrin IX monomethyl ester cyclase